MKPLTLELYQQALTLGEQLQKTFPKCFFPMGQEKPLKVGIFHDLAARCHELSPQPDKKTLRAFMSIYTSSLSYRAALIAPGAARVDLNGNEGESITDKERYKAKVTTRQIRWALDTEGYEAERAQAKSKLKEQTKKSNKENKSKAVVKDAGVSTKNKGAVQKQPTLQVNSTSPSPQRTVAPKQAVPVVVKKRRIASPPNNLKKN